MVFVECLFGGHRRNKTPDIVQRRRHKVHKISIFVLRSLAEGSHFTKTIASQKSLAARLSEGRATSTLHIKRREYLENVQRIFLKI